jgi:hypothetical protein
LLEEHGGILSINKFKPAGTPRHTAKLWGVCYSKPDELLTRPTTSVDKHGRMKAKVDIDDESYTNLVDMARRLVPESRSTTIGIAATAQRQTVLSTDALGALLFVCRRFDALKAEHLDLQKELHGMTSTLPFTALKEGGEARRDRLRRGRTLGSSLLAVAGSYDKMVEPLGNLVQRDHLLAALISSSTHSKQGETGGRMHSARLASGPSSSRSTRW